MSNAIKIILKALTDSAMIRSKRGIVVLVLQDSLEGVKTYKGKKYVKDTFTTANKAIIDKCFSKYGVHTLKVVCYSESISEALQKLNNDKFNYLSCPAAASDSDKKLIADFIKEQREANNILVHAVLNKYKPDHEGIISFDNDTVTTDSELTGAEYCVDVACQIATVGFDRSLTGLLVSDVVKASEIEDVDIVTEAGGICLYYDYDLEGYVFSDGVNSKTTIKDNEKDVLKKIRICEIFDMVRDDLKVSFKKSYRGKYGNSYNRRKLIRDAFNLYFKTLQKTEILNPDEDCSCWLNVDRTREYLESNNVDTSDMSDEEVLKKDVVNKLFLKGRIYALDTTDELEFELNY